MFNVMAHIFDLGESQSRFKCFISFLRPAIKLRYKKSSELKNTTYERPFMDWTIYWFMFPVSMMVSLSAMVSGIGGSALFMPIYVIIFPLLGPEYPFEATITAVLVALITMGFSFSSGTSVYAYKRLIDYKMARSFLILSLIHISEPTRPY